MTRRILIVAPHFAPINAPDGHRVRLLLPWLTEYGWQPTVLSVRPEFATAPIEPALEDTIPGATPVHRVAAFATATSRRMGIGNLGWRCLPWLWREGSRLLRSEKFDLVYFSTTQFAVLPLGRWWRRRFHVPYVIDLQDPWHNTFYAQPGAPRPPGGWKYRVAAVTTARSEGWTLRRCSHVITVSRRYIEDLQQRRPWFNSSRTTVIPFGWSVRDQSAARKQRVPPATSASIVYVGRVGEDMARLLRTLLTAFGEWFRARAHRNTIVWHFVGTSYAGDSRGGGVAARIAAELGLTGVVREEPGRIGYLEAIARQQASGANLILGSDDNGYSPSKIWPLLAAGRPWLACVGADTVLAAVLRPHEGAGLLMSVSPADTAPRPPDRFFQFLDRLAEGSLVPPPPAAELGQFHADRLARQHADVFNQLMRR